MGLRGPSLSDTFLALTAVVILWASERNGGASKPHLYLWRCEAIAPGRLPYFRPEGKHIEAKKSSNQKSIYITM